MTIFFLHSSFSFEQLVLLKMLHNKCFSVTGIGKTTLIQKATEVLKTSGIPIDGFYTEEVREGGRRTGFDVVTLSGRRGILSRVGY